MAPKKPGRPKADHYHTGEIVLRLERDKRRSWLLFAGSVVSAVAIITFFTLQGQHSSGKPDGSGQASTGGAPANPNKAENAPRTSVLTPLPPAPPPPPPVTVQVQVSATKQGVFWLDTKPLGLKKQFDLTLSPGTYELKGKFGRKTLTEKLTVDPNAPLTVRFDPRKKKPSVKPTTP